MNPLLIQAIKKAGQMRAKLGLDMFSPVNIFETCSQLGLSVRFIDVNMEGMYINQEGVAEKVILISSLRPLPRRVYTCAHELGHHLFGHGSKVDGLNEEGAIESVYDKDEYLVDSFAAAFLMPVASIEKELTKRGWLTVTLTPAQIYSLSSLFGTGYSTFIKHCKANKIILEQKARELLKITPAKLLQNLADEVIPNSHFKIVNEYYNQKLIDIEVGNYLILPEDSTLDRTHFDLATTTEGGKIFTALHPGIFQLSVPSSEKSYFVRVQNAGFVGLAEHRYLENQTDKL